MDNTSFCSVGVPVAPVGRSMIMRGGVPNSLLIGLTKHHIQ